MKASKKNVKDIPVDFTETDEKSVPENDEAINEEETNSVDETVADEKDESNGDAVEEKETGDDIEEKYESLNDQFLRLRAEFVNYKKRVEREKIEFTTYLKTEIFKQILPVMDDFDQMLKHSKEGSNDTSVVEGAKIIRDKLMSAMENEGLKKMDALNVEFDPEYHEAMLMQKIEDSEQNNKIINVFQEGYLLNERLVRPAKVIVGNYEE